MTTQPVPAPDLRWSFGDRIRKIRRAVGASQTEFAAAIGQGSKAIGAWETGTNEPRNAVAIAKRIELAYRVPATWTLGLDDKTPGPEGPGNDGESRQQPFGYRLRGEAAHLRMVA